MIFINLFYKKMNDNNQIDIYEKINNISAEIDKLKNENNGIRIAFLSLSISITFIWFILAKKN